MTFSDVSTAFDKGTVWSAAREDLRAYLTVLTQTRVLDPANQARVAHMREVILRRLSDIERAEDKSGPNWQRIAVWVGLGSFVSGFIIAYLAFA